MRRQTGIKQGYRPATMEADDPRRAFIDWEGQTELKLTLQSLIPEALRTSGGFLPVLGTSLSGEVLVQQWVSAYCLSLKAYGRIKKAQASCFTATSGDKLWGLGDPKHQARDIWSLLTGERRDRKSSAAGSSSFPVHSLWPKLPTALMSPPASPSSCTRWQLLSHLYLELELRL